MTFNLSSVQAVERAAPRQPRRPKMMGPVKKGPKTGEVDDQTLYGQVRKTGLAGGDMGSAPVVFGVEKGTG